MDGMLQRNCQQLLVEAEWPVDQGGAVAIDAAVHFCGTGRELVLDRRVLE
jgi:hypothetical protein